MARVMEFYNKHKLPVLIGLFISQKMKSII